MPLDTKTGSMVFLLKIGDEVLGDLTLQTPVKCHVTDEKNETDR